MNRRSFLKSLGLGGGVSALSACGIDDNVYYTPIEQILPYVTRPEQVTPGVNTHFATSVGTGPNAWPVVSVHRDGRVINVSSNPRAPVPTSVSASHLLEVQRHYSPDRWQQPMRRQGEQTEPVPWETATQELTAAVRQAREDGKKVVWMGPYANGVLVDLLREVTGGEALFWEPLGLDAERLAAQALFGSGAGIPRFDLTEARYILSFGAPFLGSGWSHIGHQAEFAAARDANRGGTVARFAAITPHRDQTAANADDWYPCTSGSEAQVALALAKLVADTKAYNGPGRAMIDQGDPAAAAAASGIPEETLRAIAANFSDRTSAGVVLPGGISGPDATRLAAATYLLNLVVADRRLFSGGGYQGPVSSYAEVEALIASLEAGEVGVLMLGDVDPVHLLPEGSRFREAMAKAGMVVAMTSFPNETVFEAPLILPTHDVFEEWGDEEPWAGFHLVRQPAMQPLYDTRSLGDLLLALRPGQAAAGGVSGAEAPVEVAGAEAPVEAAPTEATWREYFTERFIERVLVAGAEVAAGEEGATPAAQVTVGPERQRWWESVLMAGFYLTRAPGAAGADLDLVGELPLDPVPAPAGTGDFQLHVFPHAFKLDGRYANEPWAQEVADPLTGQVWGSWVLVHPTAAERLGVRDNDQVKVETASGSVLVGVEVTPNVRPDVIAIPLGDGRSVKSGRYADGIGINVSTLIPAGADASGALVMQGTRCSVTATGEAADLVSLYGADSDQGRGFVAVVNAAEWHGDEPTAEPGHLTGLHEVPMDHRLVEAERQWQEAQGELAAAGLREPVEPEHREFTSMYPVPDHPTYRFAMTVDTNRCTGCSACIVACYAENNLPVVGKWKVSQGREMAWIRINRYYADHSADESPSVHFVPMLCQHCGHAPCESVCPVLATYHTIDGLNAMVYNRCVGTRYCANACPYSVRRFNYHSYVWPEPFNLQLNPDVSSRTMGVMEKCTFCVQRIRRVKNAFRDQGFTNTIPDEALRELPACVDACPSQALTFGNLLDPTSVPAVTRKSGRSYTILAEINTYPAINYLARASFHVHRPDDHAGPGHAGQGHDGGTHGGGESHDAERG
jgi:Fe-S-cluster-containing dehydrogenase component/anaerobic selenocysteine-containing dehydrogenase